jgi:outer membrane protein TolC
MKKIIVFFSLILSLHSAFAQNSENIMTLAEYLSYVKAYHPLIKQANLVVSEAEAKLLQARGAFDPKIEIDHDKKTFKNTEYYNKLNAAFKIPTWFGIELKGQFEDHEGVYLNPEHNVPEDGLYGVGISVPLAKGLLTNDRMAMLKKAKLYVNQNKETQKLLVNETLYKAIIAYFDWLLYYNELQVYQAYMENSEQRLAGVKRNYELGQAAAIDTTEAKITIYNRQLNLENAHLKLKKSQLALSNFLWIQDIPVELNVIMIPDVNTEQNLETYLFNIKSIPNNFDVDTHPKLVAMRLKAESLNVERRLYLNNLLPTVNFKYNFLTETPDYSNSFNVDNYKLGLQVSVPLFLRKERGKLKLAKTKIANTQFDISTLKVQLQNKIESIEAEIGSYNNQTEIVKTMISSYEALLQAEERKFQIGESSLFLVNSRESKLINAQLKALELYYKLMQSKAKLFNTTIFNDI